MRMWAVRYGAHRRPHTWRWPRADVGGSHMFSDGEHLVEVAPCGCGRFEDTRLISVIGAGGPVRMWAVPQHHD